jgi:protein CpxP
MKLNGNHFTFSPMRLLTAAALVSTLAFAPSIVLAAERDAHTDRVEHRIDDMHAKLKITPAEEAQWAKVVDAMRDEAKSMDTLINSRAEHGKDMTAVDSLKSYGEISEAHADGIKKLTPLFADLYASMSDQQKQTADKLFRHDGHKHGYKHSHKHDHKDNDTMQKAK